MSDRTNFFVFLVFLAILLIHDANAEICGQEAVVVFEGLQKLEPKGGYRFSSEEIEVTYLELDGGVGTIRSCISRPQLAYLFDHENRRVKDFYIEAGETRVLLSIDNTGAEVAEVESVLLSQRLYAQFSRVLDRFPKSNTGIGRTADEYRALADEIVSLAIDNPDHQVTFDILTRLVSDSVNAPHLDAETLRRIKRLFGAGSNHLHSSGAIDEILVHLQQRLPGNKFPYYQATTVGGASIVLSELLENKFVLVELWSSGCVPCREKMPSLRETEQRFGESGFQIVAVSIDESHAKWVRAIARDETSEFVHLSQGRGTEDSLMQYFGLQSIPQNFLLDSEGFIVASNIFYEDLDEKLETLLAE